MTAYFYQKTITGTNKIWVSDSVHMDQELLTQAWSTLENVIMHLKITWEYSMDRHTWRKVVIIYFLLKYFPQIFHHILSCFFFLLLLFSFCFREIPLTSQASFSNYRHEWVKLSTTSTLSVLQFTVKSDVWAHETFKDSLIVSNEAGLDADVGPLAPGQ